MTNMLTVGLGLYTHKGFESFAVEQLYELITAPCGFIRSKTLDVRRSGWNPTLQKHLKSELPIVMANGVFDKRLNTNLIEYSRYIIIDLDYELPRDEAKRDADLKRIRCDPYSRLVHLSPREGIKILVEHDNCDPAHHAELYDVVAAHFGTTATDTKCRDLARANFICYDADAQLNLSSKVFSFTPTGSGAAVKLHTPKWAPKVVSSKTLLSRYEIKPIPAAITSRREMCRVISLVQKWADKRFPVAKGARNSNLFTFACVLHDRGVSYDDALFYLTSKYVASDFLGDEIEQIVINAYKN